MNAIQRTRRSSRNVLTPEQKKRKKITQFIFAGVVIALLVVIALIAQAHNPKGAFIVFIGTALGYILQRSRFCFTASLRDPMLTGGTNLTKAVIISLAVLSFIFMALNMQKLGLNLEHLSLEKFNGFGNVKALGFHTAIGAFLFGIGAVIAGGCASGTVMRMGEGFLQQWLVFPFFVIGSIVGLPLTKMMVESASKNTVFLPKAFGGWLPAIIVQFGALLILYIIADKWGKKNASR